ncbi:MAG TPA: c-type cytochrome [Cellvibrio sp.]|uniref:Cytochrome c4 n=1 Tax=Cellvibrio mixtus TaxID=39650 RepID=A0A266QCR3_9GAMM|nr:MULTISPECIES: c-type cytochrome [Cellvibrio]AQT61369.1 cytochrome c4 [Cellvibrio sp. PSBB023]OZY87657.1 cytochrome c4 [Cellvibrio mixtus]
MKHIVRNALLSLGLVAVAQGAMAAGDATAGAAKAAVCGACHGADGNSLVGTFPKLAGLGEKYLLKQLHDIQAWDLEQDAAKKATTGRKVPEMVGLLANLNDQDLADIAAHFAAQTMQLSGSKPLEVQVNSGLKVDALALGQRTYRAGNIATGVPACTGCHTPDGKGNVAAGFPRLSGQHPEYIEKQLRAFRAGDRTNDGDQMTMRSVAAQLSDAEIVALANYIAGLH